tara:strand:+ start:18 stop:611 length:594 start_codon:yes stop_codon:yes gene_type:complete
MARDTSFGRKNNIFNLSYKKTFSFERLSLKIIELAHQTAAEITKESAIQTKKNLETKRFKPLAPFTLKMRKEGYGWGGKKVAPTDSKKPLIQTGTLRDSIKYSPSKKAMLIKSYGILQNKGYTNIIKRRYMNPKFVDVPARRFIAAPKGSIIQSVDLGSTEFTGFTKPMTLRAIRTRYMKRVRKHLKSKQVGYKKLP